uniref:P1 n=1 Tax=Bitter gourd yellowing crumple virus TaxID=3078811 RepID=A0AA96RRD5_9VIRU|nr:P1 [Bitter gourd yellowing crumple virus]
MAYIHSGFFLLVCLCSSVSSYQGTMFIPLEPVNASNWLDFTATAVRPSPPPVQLIYDCPLQKTLRDFSSREIIQELWGRGCNSARQTSLEAIQSSQSLLMSGARQLRAGSKSLLRVTLKVATYLWSSLIWATLCASWFLLREYSMEMLLLGSLYVFTVYMVKTAAWIFGDLPIFLLRAGLSMVKGCSRVLWCKRPYKAEKSVEGFLSFKIPQTPPKNSVLHVQHKDGSHAGYATCVMLYNGSTGLVTAQHVIKPGCMIVSTRNGSKIPAAEFKEIINSATRDITLLAGPPNWEGALACKAVQFLTARNLCKSKASNFTWSNNAWHSSNADIVGLSACRKYVSVLSKTEPGDSGSPYFNGKTLLGVHIGGATEENVNYMAPIPPLEGLTVSKYVFETTAPMGKIFTEEEIADLVEEFSFSEIQSIARARMGKQLTHREETVPQSGNGKAAATAQTTAGKEDATRRRTQDVGGQSPPPAAPSKKATYTPPQKRGNAGAQSQATTASSDALSEIKHAILEKINLRSIEKQVVEALADKAMKKPPHRRRGRRGSKNKQENSSDTSVPSTNGNGRWEKKPQGSNKLEPSPSFTTLNKREIRRGGQKSAQSTQKWVPIQRASGGPNSAPKRS